MYFNSQSAEVIELPVLSCMPPSWSFECLAARWDQTQTLPSEGDHSSLSAFFYPQKIWTAHTLILGKHTENCSNRAFTALVPVLQNRNELELRLSALLPTRTEPCAPSPVQLAGSRSARCIPPPQHDVRERMEDAQQSFCQCSPVRQAPRSRALPPCP